MNDISTTTNATTKPNGSIENWLHLDSMYPISSIMPGNCNGDMWMEASHKVIRCSGHQMDDVSTTAKATTKPNEPNES